MRFLGHKIFHPFHDIGPRDPTVYLRLHEKADYCNFDRARYIKKDDPNVFRIHGAEMKQAFKVLRAAGYHIFRTTEYRTWIGYVCKEKPFIENGTEVFEFNDFID